MSDKKKMQPKEDPKKRKKEVMPQQDIDTSSPSPGSMSEGNLSNNRYGRTKSRTPHAKNFVMGTDDDGQTD